jgi:hypothetical protein
VLAAGHPYGEGGGAERRQHVHDVTLTR